jgi:hypothetical protein
MWAGSYPTRELRRPALVGLALRVSSRVLCCRDVVAVVRALGQPRGERGRRPLQARGRAEELFRDHGEVRCSRCRRRRRRRRRRSGSGSSGIITSGNHHCQSTGFRLPSQHHTVRPRVAVRAVAAGAVVMEAREVESVRRASPECPLAVVVDLGGSGRLASQWVGGVQSAGR